MNQKIYQVDAFALNLYEGNPAAVVILDDWIKDETMQNIAMENNLAETAFLVKKNEDTYSLRWFTPTIEVDLCGHATLASAHILFTEYNYNKDVIYFDTRSGRLKVDKLNSTKYMMDFPSDEPMRINKYDNISSVLKVIALDCYKGKDDTRLGKYE